MFLFRADSKRQRPLFCQFVPPLSEDKESFKKKPLVSVFPVKRNASHDLGRENVNRLEGQEVLVGIGLFILLSVTSH